eukprot:scaffold249961_cov21-Tisochrysis_lutea.AAC.1
MAQQPRAKSQSLRLPSKGERLDASARSVLRNSHLDVLHDDVDIGGRFDDLVQADDVGVHEQPEDLDFSPNYSSRGRKGGAS